MGISFSGFGDIANSLPKRGNQFAKWLDKSWHEEGAVRAIAEAISAALPESRVFLLPGAVDKMPGWVLDSFESKRNVTFRDIGLNENSSNPLRNHLSKLVRYRCYDSDPNGPLTNRPVNNSTVAAAFGTEKFLFRMEQMLTPLKIEQQLRTVIYSKEQGPLFFGAFRGIREANFTELDHARLFALQEPLLNWWRIASVIGLQPLVESQLTQSLVRLNDAALLLHKGKVVFVNPVASAHSGQIPKWLSAVKQGKLGSFPLQLADLRLELVLTPVSDTHFAPLSLKQPLPSYLAPVYQGLEKGLADKEIAQATSLSLETTRTYVKRIFAHLNVHSRREIIALRGSSPTAVPDADSSPKR